MLMLASQVKHEIRPGDLTLCSARDYSCHSLPGRDKARAEAYHLEYVICFWLADSREDYNARVDNGPTRLLPFSSPTSSEKFCGGELTGCICVGGRASACNRKEKV